MQTARLAAFWRTGNRRASPAAARTRSAIPLASTMVRKLSHRFRSTARTQPSAPTKNASGTVEIASPAGADLQDRLSCSEGCVLQQLESLQHLASEPVRREGAIGLQGDPAEEFLELRVRVL